MIIAIPLATVLVIGGLQFADTLQQAQDAAQLRELVALSTSSAQLADRLENERMAAIDAVLSDSARSRFHAQVKATDAALSQYRAKIKKTTVTSGLSDSVNDVERYLDSLDTLRSQVTAQTAPTSSVALRYEIVISALNSYRESVAQNTDVSTAGNAIRAAALFSEAKQDVSYEEAVAYLSLRSGQYGSDTRETFLTALHGQEQALVSFLDSGTPAQQQLVRDAVSGDAVTLAELLTTKLSRATAAPDIAPDDVRTTYGAVVNLMRWVETRLDAGVTNQVIGHEDQTFRQALVDGSVVAVAILLAMLLVVALARRLSRSLSDLRVAADSVAGRDLPAAVAQLRDASALTNTSPAELSSRSYRPVPVTSTDEVGRVAAAFNGVQREAIRIAVEQAVLRANVSATFISVARRSQKFVDRLIASLDRVERDEDHPERLAQLFELDHLATRMRRNDENLLILADADAVSPRKEDAALADVMAAAQSEIARYERIRIGPLNLDGQPGEAVMVHAEAVNDVVRIFAELLENAANFSPPNQHVQVTGRRVGDQTLVEIEDHGIGMTQERRDELNARLADPESSDLGSVRMMGFAVVARLTARYQIRVRLGTGRNGGTVAHVMLPASLVARHRNPPSPVAILDRPAGPSLGRPPARPASEPPPLSVPWTPEFLDPDRSAPRERGPRDISPVPPMASRDRPTELPIRGQQPAEQPPARPVEPLPRVEPESNEWFSSRTVRTSDDDEAEPSGRHAAHPGWAAAAYAAAPSISDETTTGLPRRDPMAQLVPGGFDRAPVEINRTASGVRSFLAEYQRGVNNGRDRAVSRVSSPYPPAEIGPDNWAPASDINPRRTGES